MNKEWTEEQVEVFNLKKKCHNVFNELCKTKDTKRHMYSWLARKLKMRPQDCHFSLMDKKHLVKALKLMENKKNETI